MAEHAKVTDWVNDWDHHDPDWVNDPYPIWEELRSACPMAHSGRYNEGVWLPLNFEDLAAIAHDTDSFSSDHDGLSAGGTVPRGRFPPIHSDPPEHQPLRRSILPFFAPRQIEKWGPAIESHCTSLAQSIAARGSGDAAVDYAQHIPVHAIAAILDVPASDGDTFRRWVVDFLEVGALDPQTRIEAEQAISDYMMEAVADRRRNPGEDLISHLTTAEVDGERLDDDVIRRMLVLQLIAGVDTTWSSIGAALWHLAANPADRQRLVDEPELIPTAVEELLRAYAPVNVMRRVAQATTVNGVDFKPGDTVMMTFPIACRDPEQFERADEVVIDRQKNRHPAFGLGIHRCLGSNLARLEMNTAISTWLQHIPDFSLAPDTEVVWSEGQIRGPRSIPIVVNS